MHIYKKNLLNIAHSNLESPTCVNEIELYGNLKAFFNHKKKSYDKISRSKIKIGCHERGYLVTICMENTEAMVTMPNFLKEQMNREVMKGLISGPSNRIVLEVVR